MSVIIILIIVSILVALFFLAVFFWAVKSGQFDDTVSPSIRMLFDEKKHTKPKEENKNDEGDSNKNNKQTPSGA